MASPETFKDGSGGLQGFADLSLHNEPVDNSFVGFLYRRSENSPGSAQEEQGIGIVSFFTAFAVALIIFAVQTLFFLLLRNKLARIL